MLVRDHIDVGDWVKFVSSDGEIVNVFEVTWVNGYMLHGVNNLGRTSRYLGRLCTKLTDEEVMLHKLSN